MTQMMHRIKTICASVRILAIVTTAFCRKTYYRLSPDFIM